MPCDRPRSLARNPSRERTCDARPRARLAGAEQEPHHEQGRITGRGRRRCSQRRPPDHDAGENRARADPIGPPARRDFEEAIRQLEYREDPAHLDSRQPKVPPDSRSERADGHTIQVGHHRQRRRERHDTITGAGSCHRRVSYPSGFVRGTAPRGCWRALRAPLRSDFRKVPWGRYHFRRPLIVSNRSPAPAIKLSDTCP